MSTTKNGILILNLGTPDSPEPDDVGRYLREFLMDKWVLDTPWLWRWILVNLLIVPRRKFASSEAYKTIWNERGSPLKYHLEDLMFKMVPFISSSDVLCGSHVEIAMRYQHPSVETALANFKANGVTKITVLALYPQYAESTSRSTIENLKEIAKKLEYKCKIKLVPPFYDDGGFIKNFADKIGSAMRDSKAQHLLLSFHGLPVRHMKKVDRSGGLHCMASETCCDRITDVNRDCYRAQSYATARKIAEALNLSVSQYTVSFQSRLGRQQWIPPYTDFVLPELAKRGVKNLVVACPSFTADCLETVEEIGIRGRADFLKAGGETFTRVDCLNADSSWAEPAVRLIERSAAQ